MTDDIALNDTQKELVNLLFYYRCAKPIQLTKFVYGPYAITVSNEKYIYGQLAKLEDDGLVSRYKPHKRISNQAVFYLSKKGFDLKQNQLALPEGYVGVGWCSWSKLKNNQVDYGHFDYSVYKPPLKQLTHHLLMIDTLLVMYPLTGITYRNNLYAKRVAQSDPRYKRVALKPDAEMLINGLAYTIEIDCGTESHEQLVLKFENYFHYLAECKAKHGQYDLQHIVFVVNAANDGHLKRRWTNILAAYYKAMRGLADTFELHLVTLDMLEDFLFVQQNVEVFKPDFSAVLLEEYDLKLDGQSVLNNGYYKSLVVDVNDVTKTYTLNYQFIATPYSTVNFKLRLAVPDTVNPMLFSVIDECYITDKLGLYLTDFGKINEQKVLAQYTQAQDKGKLVEFRR